MSEYNMWIDRIHHYYGEYITTVCMEDIPLGAIQVLRNADGGGGGVCQIFRKESVTKV